MGEAVCGLTRARAREQMARQRAFIPSYAGAETACLRDEMVQESKSQITPFPVPILLSMDQAPQLDYFPHEAHGQGLPRCTMTAKQDL